MRLFLLLILIIIGVSCSKQDVPTKPDEPIVLRVMYVNIDGTVHWTEYISIK